MQHGWDCLRMGKLKKNATIFDGTMIQHSGPFVSQDWDANVSCTLQNGVRLFRVILTVAESSQHDVAAATKMIL